jgi:hypothetical protein
MTAPNDIQPPLVSTSLAHALKGAGLRWNPTPGDRFHIPDRGLDDQTFSISEMVVEMRRGVGGELELAFNGTVEWALDAIVKTEVVWLPNEGQLRATLGEHFIALYADETGYGCVARIDGEPSTFTAPTAAEAYGLALLAHLRHAGV